MAVVARAWEVTFLQPSENPLYACCCPNLFFFLSSLLSGKPKALSAKAMHQSWEDRKAGSGGRVYEMEK